MLPFPDFDRGSFLFVPTTRWKGPPFFFLCFGHLHHLHQTCSAQIRVRCQFGLSNCKSSWCRWGSIQFNCTGNSDPCGIVLGGTSALSRCKEIATWHGHFNVKRKQPFPEGIFNSWAEMLADECFTRGCSWLVPLTFFVATPKSPKGRQLVTSSSCREKESQSGGWKSQRVRVRLRHILDLHYYLFSWCFNGNENSCIDATHWLAPDVSRPFPEGCPSSMTYWLQP